MTLSDLIREHRGYISRWDEDDDAGNTMDMLEIDARMTVEDWKLVAAEILNL